VAAEFCRPVLQRPQDSIKNTAYVVEHIGVVGTEHGITAGSQILRPSQIMFNLLRLTMCRAIRPHGTDGKHGIYFGANLINTIDLTQ